MEPVTHALASAALAQAGLNRTTRLAMPMAIVAGLAADVDLLSLAGGAPRISITTAPSRIPRWARW